jgi:hypothetical protein
MKVRFIQVGRNNASWEAECRGELTESWMYNQVKKHLMSRDIEFGDGVIYAGLRAVGRFEIIENVDVEG